MDGQIGFALRRGTPKTAALVSLAALMGETGATDVEELTSAVARSRAARALRTSVADAEKAIKSAGDAKALKELLDSVVGVDPNELTAKAQTLSSELTDLNAEVDVAAMAHGDARWAFESLEQ